MKMNGKIAIVLFLLASLVIPAYAGAAGHEAGKVPPGEAGAKTALERSPRHHEWVTIAVPGKEHAHAVDDQAEDARGAHRAEPERPQGVADHVVDSLAGRARRARRGVWW